MGAATKHNKAALATHPQGEGSYRDDPDALSMHTTRDDYEYDEPELPSYSDSVAVDTVPEPPADEYARYISPTLAFPRGGQSSSPSKAIGSETSIRMDDRLCDPGALDEYISYLRVVPPNPFVRIQGWHWETVKKDNKKERSKVYDFDVVLSLQKYLPQCEPGWWQPQAVENGSKVHRGGWKAVRAPGYKQDIEVGHEPKRDLKEWCEDFCSSKSSLKIFRVSRTVAGLDTEKLSSQVIPLVRSTNYRGQVDVSFPTADRNVDIYSPHWINRARISWVRWIFYLTFLWIFTWPILFFLTKRWNVYHVEWRFSAWFEESHGASDPVRLIKYATLSETDWVKKHENLIRSLVLDKFQGDGTDMSTDINVDLNRRDGGRPQQTGNRNVDAAVSFVHGGLQAWNSINGRQTGGGWGMDS